LKKISICVCVGIGWMRIYIFFPTFNVEHVYEFHEGIANEENDLIGEYISRSHKEKITKILDEIIMRRMRPKKKVIGLLE
jgi:hypothetical protein